MAVASRRVTVRFARLHRFEHGLRARLHWNGRVAANGDGLPPIGGSGDVDYDADRAAVAAARVVQAGQLGFGAGGLGAGLFGLGGPAGYVDAGIGQHGFGLGELGAPLGFHGTRLPRTLRDGRYRVGVVPLDAAGNAGPASEIEFEVAALPRPVEQLAVSRVNPTTVRVTWSESPDTAVE